MEIEKLILVYLALFFEAWKKGYKMGWIYHQMVEKNGKEVTDAFFACACEKCQPLVPSIPRPFMNTPRYLVVMSQKFSDWVHDKNPSTEKFCETVLKNQALFLDSESKWKNNKADEGQNLSDRKWDALDSFGGKVKNLRADQLVYDSAGRTTGKGASEKTWAKK